MIKIHSLFDDAKCFESVRELRWPRGVRCCHCQSSEVIRQGYDDTQPHRRRYRCKRCARRFDDLSGTIFAGHHQPLRVWMACLYLMGLNLSNRQLAQELGLSESDTHEMTSQLRTGVVDAKPEVKLEGDVECDEVYIVAGHKGHPEEVKKRGGRDVEGASEEPEVEVR